MKDTKTTCILLCLDTRSSSSALLDGSHGVLEGTASRGHAAGPSFDTTSVGENIIFRPSVNWKANAKEAENGDLGVDMFADNGGLNSAGDLHFLVVIIVAVGNDGLTGK
jgi:hypothetical protein